MVKLQGEDIKSWHRANVSRVADLLAIRIGRATSQGRPIMWSPRPELMQDRPKHGRSSRRTEKSRVNIDWEFCFHTASPCRDERGAVRGHTQRAASTRRQKQINATFRPLKWRSLNSTFLGVKSASFCGARLLLAAATNIIAQRSLAWIGGTLVAEGGRVNSATFRRAKKTARQGRSMAFVSVAASLLRDFISTTVTRLESFAAGYAAVVMLGMALWTAWSD
jgi:hypothetical protein